MRPLRRRGPGTRGGGEGSDKRPEVKSLEYWWYCISAFGGGGRGRETWDRFIYGCEIGVSSGSIALDVTAPLSSEAILPRFFPICGQEFSQYCHY